MCSIFARRSVEELFGTSGETREFLCLRATRHCSGCDGRGGVVDLCDGNEILLEVSVERLNRTFADKESKVHQYFCD